MAVTFYPNYIHYVGYAAADEPSITTQGYACSGGETTGPAYDLVDGRRTSVITVDTSGEATDFTVDFDLTANITNCNFCIVDNHNFLTATANLVIRNNVNTEMTPTAYSGTLGAQLSAVNLSSNIMLIPTDGVLLATFAASSENNWDLSFTDFDAANYSADVTMGEVVLGVSFSPAISPEINVVKGYQYGSSYVQSDGGQRYGFNKFASRKTWILNWAYMSEANKTSLEAVFAITQGSRYPFYINLGETSPPTIYLVRFATDALEFTQKTAGAYGISIKVEQEI